MGPNDENSYVDHLMVDGDPVVLEGICDHMETTLRSVQDDDMPLILRQQDPETVKVELKLAKRYRCNSRKRFVKLLMAEGISRDEANLMAWASRFYKRSYQESYLIYRLVRM